MASAPFVNQEPASASSRPRGARRWTRAPARHGLTAPRRAPTPRAAARATRAALLGDPALRACEVERGAELLEIVERATGEVVEREIRSGGGTELKRRRVSCMADSARGRRVGEPRSRALSRSAVEGSAAMLH